jgi:hypothetical protein
LPFATVKSSHRPQRERENEQSFPLRTARIRAQRGLSAGEGFNISAKILEVREVETNVERIPVRHLAESRIVEIMLSADDDSPVK